ncbi:phosphopantothenoylcysteine synthetase/decarboxylase [Streptosporangium becharense]|uniref:Phosphopantothenoylcysteine synthetase/decarboxylase n=1 Tax=Streptosporangium becharense TaxID=1816182 RepID=A0A7W9MII9_9ACTN|nr:flavoprotein [Streptosporangium becharense]MBB2910901.1 phosphopantothenoylcysteine synthetase/decarboxylase [Streptosporangium becharense]MBB5822040.1 phosphopantothenoylcysteine synthetase/decarboxylase [Streptosporangium becharense]
MTEAANLLQVIVCAAGPAADAGRLVRAAQGEGWTVQVVATPAALDFVDVDELGRQTGRPVRSRYRTPDEPKPPRADAIVVAPATYNTVNKFAQGIADTYALGLLAEAPGLGIPVVVMPCVNAALASRAPFRRSVRALRAEGVRVLLGPEGFGPGAAGGDPAEAYPWHLAVAALGRPASGSG